MPCAFALHLAFPRSNLPWLAPLALAGLFTAWMSVPPRTAACLGYAAGILYFACDFSWFGETAGALLGPFGFIVTLGPAIAEAFAFAVAAAAASYAAARLSGVGLPIAVAAAFTLAEVLRSSGLLGVPLYQVGAAFVETPLAPLLALGGVYAVTFLVALGGAALAVVALAGDRRPASLRLGAFLAVALAGTTLAWWWWPARRTESPTLRVAAIQGDIAQSIKWRPATLARSVDRYTALTSGLRAFHPAFVLWPETVITTDLLVDPALAAVPANADLAFTATTLQRRFAWLARSMDTVIAVGTDEAAPAGAYDDLVFFTPTGMLDRPYRKRQLVPFAEFLPGPDILRALPFASLISKFSAGAASPPVDARLRIGPLICWEAGFGDLAQTQAAEGARFFAIATDDAWFGDSDGPYAQAQLAQLRAIETGRWVVRAAATGVSGIIAPDGRWQTESRLDTAVAVRGTIGSPAPTPYSRLGPWPIAAAVLLLGGAGFGWGGRRRTR